MTKYRVTGDRAVLGHAPGSVFEADLDSDLEQRLLARGALAKTRSDAKTHEGESESEQEGSRSDG